MQRFKPKTFWIAMLVLGAGMFPAAAFFYLHGDYPTAAVNIIGGALTCPLAVWRLWRPARAVEVSSESVVGTERGRPNHVILRRLFPLRPGYVESGKSLEELTPVYRKWELYSLPLLLVFGSPLVAVWWWVLYRIGALNAERFSGAVYHLWPSVIVTWGVPAMLLGIVTTAVPLTLFYKWRLRERYPEFERYMNLRHGYNQNSAVLPLCAFFGAIVLVMVVLLLHWRVILTNDEIAQYPFFSLSSVSHKYQDIADIRTAPKRRAPNGDINDNDDYETEFSDASVWSTYPNAGDLTSAEKRQMMEFVSKKSGKPIRQVPIL